MVVQKMRVDQNSDITMEPQQRINQFIYPDIMGGNTLAIFEIFIISDFSFSNSLIKGLIFITINLKINLQLFTSNT